MGGASCNVTVDVSADFAQFTRPEAKVERMSYDVPTPSACRGILNAIYSKPKEFYYEITGIDVMNPIRTLSMKKNEIQNVADTSKIYSEDYFIDSSECRTQRMNTYLRDVYYRIYARIVVHDGMNIDIRSLKDQFERRVAHGKCFFQPACGTRECICYFQPPDLNRVPIDQSKDFGVMLYDVFDITKDNSEKTLDTRKKTLNLCRKVTFFRAKMVNGHIDVPLWDSGELLMND